MSEDDESVAKRAMRAKMRQARQAIPAGERLARSERITEMLASLDEIASAEVVMAFSSFGTEVSTGQILRLLAEGGKQVLLPIVESGEMSAGTYRPGDPLVQTRYGGLEPRFRDLISPSAIDAIVLPGLAFDRLGGRLGYGGAFYDRFCQGVRPDTALLGIGFAEQLVAHVPMAGHDVRVQMVVTDLEVVRCNR